MEGHQKIAEQSRAWLINAFFKLLAHREYASITVNEIAAAAELSRRTFYRHFTSRDDLLQKYLEGLFTAYTEQLTRLTITKHEDTLLLFFNFWQQYRQELNLLQERELFDRFLRCAREWYPRVYRQLNVPWHVEGAPREIKYVAAFSAGGYFTILAQWLQDGCQESPREMTNLMTRMLFSFQTC